MMLYQRESIDRFLDLLPPSPVNILEIGSDLSAEVAIELTKKKGTRVIGINPAISFPNLISPYPGESSLGLIRADGCYLPFESNSFDAIISIATLEHVNNIETFMGEVARVLKPKGIFYTNFNPIWSSARGHHVFAKKGAKEARFWKPGKNPIPDYAHLFMTSQEMREQLRSSPCCDELIEPIIQWIYYDDAINRCHFEEYIKVFEESPLEIQRIKLQNDAGPTEEITAILYARYGAQRNFISSGISATFIKLPQAPSLDYLIIKYSSFLKKKVIDLKLKWYFWMIKKFPEIRYGMRLLRGIKRLFFKPR